MSSSPNDLIFEFNFNNKVITVFSNDNGKYFSFSGKSERVLSPIGGKTEWKMLHKTYIF